MRATTHVRQGADPPLLAGTVVSARFAGPRGHQGRPAVHAATAGDNGQLPRRDRTGARRQRRPGPEISPGHAAVRTSAGSLAAGRAGRGGSGSRSGHSPPVPAHPIAQRHTKVALYRRRIRCEREHGPAASRQPPES